MIKPDTRTDTALLQALGQRLAALRLAENLSQAELAERAGVSKRTVERAEAGAAALQVNNLLRLLRALQALDTLDQLVPPATLSPIDQHQRRGRPRQRASGERTAAPQNASRWTWGDDS